MWLEKTHCQKHMYMQYILLATIAHITELKYSFCGPDKGAIYCHAYLIYIHRICIIWNYIHIEIYVHICTCTVRSYTLCVYGLAMGLSERGPTVLYSPVIFTWSLSNLWQRWRSESVSSKIDIWCNRTLSSETSEPGVLIQDHQIKYNIRWHHPLLLHQSSVHFHYPTNTTL
jgi:hypothetical protein